MAFDTYMIIDDGAVVKGRGDGSRAGAADRLVRDLQFQLGRKQPHHGRHRRYRSGCR